MDYSNSKDLYDTVYKVDHVNYGGVGCDVDDRFAPQFKVVQRYIEILGIESDATVLEVGCGVGRLHACHIRWKGIEYSETAVKVAKELFGNNLNIVEGDARSLPVDSDSIDLYFSFAALEHVPDVEKAFDEIQRVVRRGGYALLAPAWNCRPWTVKKLEQRPYSELGTSEMLGKALIPLRNSLGYRLLCSLPGRISREIRLAFGARELELQYVALEPDFSLWKRFPHISDDDAFISMDAHAAIAYFASRGWSVVSHPDVLRRFFCRGGEVVVQKPR